MYTDVKYHKTFAEVFLQALDSIPLVREGKGDIDALSSFSYDMKTFKRFRHKYTFAENKVERMNLIKTWNHFIQLRNTEDFIPHSSSKHKNLYYLIFI